jgi:hypothetical protein
MTANWAKNHGVSARTVYQRIKDLRDAGAVHADIFQLKKEHDDIIGAVRCDHCNNPARYQGPGRDVYTCESCWDINDARKRSGQPVAVERDMNDHVMESLIRYHKSMEGLTYEQKKRY